MAYPHPVPFNPHLDTSKARIHDNTDTWPQSRKWWLVVSTFISEALFSSSGANCDKKFFRGVLHATEFGGTSNETWGYSNLWIRVKTGVKIIFQAELRFNPKFPFRKRCCNWRTQIGHWSHTTKSISRKSYSIIIPTTFSNHNIMYWLPSKSLINIQ